MVGAVRGLQRLGLAPRAKVQLQSVVEEECTGNGALACVLAGHTADAAILTEPTRSAIWNAQVGVLWFQVRVLGAPAHAGDADEGANAIEASYAVIGALRELEAELNVSPPPLYAAYPHPIHLNVGMIRGGDWPSTVAGECVTHCRLALFPGERVETLKQRVEQTVATRRREPPRARAAAHRGALRGLPVRGLRARARRAADHRPVRRVRAHDGPGAAAVRLDRDDGRAHVPALRRHARGLLRPGRGERARRRRARPPAVGDEHRAGARAVHRRLVRRRSRPADEARARGFSAWTVARRRPRLQPCGHDHGHSLPASARRATATSPPP